MTVQEHRPAARTPEPMYMLAFDHRQVLRDLYPQASPADLAAAKLTVLEALERLPPAVATRSSLAFLVDEEYGADAARAARERGFYVAMSVEASRTKVLQLQYPDDFEARFARLDPQCVKALVFHNPADDAERKATQLGLLQRIHDFARTQERDFLLEVLITPTAEQLQASGGDRARFRSELFGDLLVASMAEMQDRGIEPDVWKVEGLESVAATAAVGDQAVAGGRDATRCIVLGSGESQEKVEQWLAYASAVPTFSGFAIGRTVWQAPLAAMLAGEVSREAAAEAVASSFAALVTAFGREPAAVRTEV